MNRFLIFLLVLGSGVGISRRFDGLPRTAAAGEGQGGGAEKCVAQNGDVNADGTVNLSDAITILGSLFLGNPADLLPLCTTRSASGLPDTGQNACYGSVEGQGFFVVSCDGAGCIGQDGSYATGCPSEGRFLDNGDGTVTDNCTGLMWQRDTPHALGWCEALAYCENLILAGHDDWRLPNVRELQSIVDYGRFNPAIDPVFGAWAGGYWSSTSIAGSPAWAWVVGFAVGDVYFVEDVGCGFKFHSCNVSAVRGGP